MKSCNDISIRFQNEITSVQLATFVRNCLENNIQKELSKLTAIKKGLYIYNAVIDALCK